MTVIPIKRFFDAMKDGEVGPLQIEEYIATWHKSGSDEPLHDFLGLTWAQYSAWVECGDLDVGAGELVSELENASNRHEGRMLYFSERGIPLMYYGPPPPRPTLTLENYCKWYDLYVIHPDGRVEQLEFVKYESVVRGRIVWADHAINPSAFYLIATLLELDVHDGSYELVLGRWITEEHATMEYTT